MPSKRLHNGVGMSLYREHWGEEPIQKAEANLRRFARRVAAEIGEAAVPQTTLAQWRTTLTKVPDKPLLGILPRRRELYVEEPNHQTPGGWRVLGRGRSKRGP